MFENLSERLSGVFDRLTKQGALSEDDVKTALREVRVALLEADVSLPVARDFVKAVQEKATGQAVTKSVTPGQQVVKIVYDELIELMGPVDTSLPINQERPTIIMLCGLQGQGKTTTAGKLAWRFVQQGEKVLLAATDTFRAGAQEQLRQWAERVGADYVGGHEGGDPAYLDCHASGSLEPMLMVVSGTEREPRVSIGETAERMEAILSSTALTPVAFSPLKNPVTTVPAPMSPPRIFSSSP